MVSLSSGLVNFGKLGTAMTECDSCLIFLWNCYCLKKSEVVWPLLKMSWSNCEDI